MIVLGGYEMSRSRLFLSFALLSVLLLSFAGIAQAQTSSDSSAKDTIGVRKILQSGKTFSDEFTADATTYLYGFVGSQGDSVTISMVQAADSDLDPFIVLLGPNGEMIASDDDGGTEIFGSSLISGVALPDNGIYLLVASTFAHIDEILVENGDQTTDPTDQTFDLTVTGNSSPASSADQALILTKDVVKGDTLDGVSSLNNPVGFYTYSGKAGDTITITNSSDEFDTVLHVFDPEGNRIAVNDDDPDSSGTNSTIRDLTLPEDGLYMIFATDVFFYNAGVTDTSLTYTGGKYTISIS